MTKFSLEEFYQMGGNKILSFEDVVSLTKNGVDYIGHDNLEEVMGYVTAEQAVNIQKFLDAAEEKKRKEVTKEVFEEEFNEAISLTDETLIKAGKVSVKTILDLAKEGIEVLDKDNYKKAIEVVGEEALKELIGESKSRYTVYRKGGKIYSIKKEFSFALGIVEWNKIVIAEADKVKIEKFKGLEDIDGIEYLGKITGKSEKKEWKVDFAVEEDGHVSFFNCKFDTKNGKNRAMVRRLRKEVNELQLKLVELQTEEELQAEEMPLQ